MGEDDGKSDISCIAGIVFVGTFRGSTPFHDSVEKKKAFRGAERAFVGSVPVCRDGDSVHERFVHRQRGHGVRDDLSGNGGVTQEGVVFGNVFVGAAAFDLCRGQHLDLHPGDFVSYSVQRVGGADFFCFILGRARLGVRSNPRFHFAQARTGGGDGHYEFPDVVVFRRGHAGRVRVVQPGTRQSRE